MASRKKAKPSRAKGKPMIEPENFVKVGQSRPISNERIVPETAPMAKSRAKAFVQRRVSVIQVASCCHRASPSAMHRSSGSPTPREAKMIWKASDVPIWARAANRSDITKSPSPFVLPELEVSSVGKTRGAGMYQNY